jgi:hypothetical protein
MDQNRKERARLPILLSLKYSITPIPTGLFTIMSPTESKNQSHSIHLDPKCYTNRKTARNESSNISMALRKNPTEVTIEELAIAVGKGQSFTPARLQGGHSDKNWVSQSLWAVDFDGGVDPAEIIQRFNQNSINPCLVYATLSDTPEKRKFRVVIQLDKTVTQEDVAKGITNLLYKHLFPEADQKCTNLSRWFLGGKEILHVDPTAVAPLSWLTEKNKIISFLAASKHDHARRKANSSKGWGGLLSKNGVSSPSSYVLLSERAKNANSPSSSAETQAGQAIPSGTFSEIKEIRDPDWEYLQSACPLLDAFLCGEWLYDTELFWLSTHLIWVEGGQSLYEGTIKKYLERCPSYDGKAHKCRYARHQGYLPANADILSGATWQSSPSLYAIAQKSSVIRISTPDTITLEDAESKLKFYYDHALQADDTKIYIIKVPTGLGKTELLTQADPEAVIAFPTYALRDEVVSRIRWRGYQKTPNLPDVIRETYGAIAHIGGEYDRGWFDEAMAEFEEFYSAVKSLWDKGKYKAAHKMILDEREYAGYMEFVEALSTSLKTANSLLTTHSKGVHHSWDKHKTIIFDEDPLPSILTTGSIPLADIKFAPSSLCAALNGVTGQILSNPLKELSEVEREGFRESLGKLVDADFIHVVEDGDGVKSVNYITRTDLPSNKKIIILSATADEFIYKQLYGDRVEFIDIGHVELQGRLMQSADRSYSRSQIQKYTPESLPQTTEPVITHSTATGLFPTAIKDMYFGNCSGIDKLKGKNIHVVGTPHPPQSAIALYAAVLGVETADMKMQRQSVLHNGFRFRFMTFASSQLQRIQFHFIERELIQAVGRARLVRENCTVHVYSNYPLPQAELN